jgi:hypothetical protein
LSPELKVVDPSMLGIGLPHHHALPRNTRIKRADPEPRFPPASGFVLRRTGDPASGSERRLGASEATQAVGPFGNRPYITLWPLAPAGLATFGHSKRTRAAAALPSVMSRRKRVAVVHAARISRAVEALQASTNVTNSPPASS